MSVRIATELSMDGEGFTRVLEKKKAEAVGFSAFMGRLGVGIFGGKSAKESAGSLASLLAAQEKLDGIRKANAAARMSDEQKVAALEADIAATKIKIAAIEGTTLEKLQLELGIEEKLLQVERLRAGIAAQHARSRAAEVAAVADAQRAEAGRLGRIAQLEEAGRQRRQAREAIEIQAAFAATRSTRSAAPAAADAGKPGLLGTIGGFLGRTFGFSQILKGVLTGFGIGTALQAIDTVVGKIAAKWERSAEAAKKISEFTERSRTAVARLIDLEKTDEQRLASLKGEARVKRRQLEFAAADPRVREQDPGIMQRLGAELDENALAQREVEKRLADAKKTELEQIRAIEREAAEERDRRQLAQLPLEKQLAWVTADAVRNQAAADRAKAGSIERAKYQLAAEKAVTEQVRLRAEIEAKAQEAWDRALAEEAKRNDTMVRLYKEEEDAKKALAKAEADLKTQRRDAISATLQELLTSPTGRRNTSAAGMAARGIVEDEARARALVRSGNRVMMFDRKTQRSFEAGPEFFQNRAEQARARLDQLKSSERDPFGQASAELKGAAADLKSAAAELQKFDVEVTVDGN